MISFVWQSALPTSEAVAAYNARSGRVYGYHGPLPEMLLPISDVNALRNKRLRIMKISTYTLARIPDRLLFTHIDAPVLRSFNMSINGAKLFPDFVTYSDNRPQIIPPPTGEYVPPPVVPDISTEYQIFALTPFILDCLRIETPVIQSLQIAASAQFKDDMGLLSSLPVQTHLLAEII